MSFTNKLSQNTQKDNEKSFTNVNITVSNFVLTYHIQNVILNLKGGLT